MVSMNALTLVFAALCTFAIGYRFYGLFIAEKVLRISEARKTPAVTMADGHDYVETNQFVLFGHHFAAIAAAGPYSYPNSAISLARFGY
jgi:carbon starvation protein